MAVKVIWTAEAEKTFDNNIDYLLKEWSEKEVRSFVDQTQKAILRIVNFPESYPIGTKAKNYRKARLNKYIVLFYKYQKSANELLLITFWNTKQDISKAKFK